MRLVLHIGATKTGSSALQSTLHARRDTLLHDARALYPQRGVVAGAHHLLAASIHPGAWRMHTDSLPEDRSAYFDETFAAIHDDVAATGAETLVLSSEYFWGSLPLWTYRRLAAAFPDWPVTIVAFVRRQDEWALSSYLQAVKHGEKRPFAEWADLRLLKEESGLNYFRVINRWAHLMGAATVHVVRYADVRDNVYRGFCTRLGFQTDTSFDVAQVNPSPSAEGLAMLLEVNRSNLPDDEKKERRREIMRSYRSSKPSTAALMSADERAAMLREGLTSDRLIREHFLDDGRPLFDLDRDPAPDREPAVARSEP